MESRFEAGSAGVIYHWDGRQGSWGLVALQGVGPGGLGPAGLPFSGNSPLCQSIR